MVSESRAGRCLAFNLTAHNCMLKSHEYRTPSRWFSRYLQALFCCLNPASPILDLRIEIELQCCESLFEFFCPMMCRRELGCKSLISRFWFSLMQSPVPFNGCQLVARSPSLRYLFRGCLRIARRRWPDTIQTKTRPEP
jgi:hypothetical protein